MNKPLLTFFVSKHRRAILPTIENEVISQNKRKGMFTLSYEHDGIYMVPLHTVSRITDKQSKTD